MVYFIIRFGENKVMRKDRKKIIRNQKFCFVFKIYFKVYYIIILVIEVLIMD